MPTSSEDIIRRVREFEPQLRASIRRYLQNEADIDEVMQDLYAKILAHVLDVGNIRSLRAFCVTMVHNAAIDRKRRQQLVPIDLVSEVDELAGADELQNPERITQGRADLESLIRFAETLPERMRQAYTLRHVYDMKDADIAAQLNVSRSSVQHLLRRAARLCADALSRANSIGKNDT